MEMENKWEQDKQDQTLFKRSSLRVDRFRKFKKDIIDRKVASKTYLLSLQQKNKRTYVCYARCNKSNF